MGDNSSFLKDFHSLQCLQDTNIQQYSPAECEYDRIESTFKYGKTFHIVKGLLYLKFLRDSIQKQIILKQKDDISLEEMICEHLVKIVRDYKEKKYFDKSFFSRVPPSMLECIYQQVENIADRLPVDHFEKKHHTFILNNTDLSKCMKNENPIFSLPLLDNLPDIENNDQRKNAFSLLYVEPKNQSNQKEIEAYPLETMFEIYKESIPNYNYNEFKSIVQDQLISDRSDDDVVAYLLDTFGYTIFDFISEIIKNRYKKIDYGDRLYVESGIAAKTCKNTSSAVIAGTVTVQSEKESNLLKKLRKIEKKERNKITTEIEQTEAEYEVARNTPIFKRQAIAKIDPDEYPHVHDQMRNHMITTKYDGNSIMQPDNAIRKITNDYAEFTIPGGRKGDIKDIELVQVKSLDTVGQLVFKDIKEFNRIQSEVFPVAYNSNENILVCAPTGAGKTNIALLTIVHQIRCHIEGNLIKKNEFKIIYVCPMKALATEMVANFSKKLAPIGISVKECTGDMQLTKKEIAETQMLVTTPEKWDVITRKGAVDTEVVGLVKLLIIDEVHLLNGSRGPVIEALVARTLRQVVSSQSMIRIVALSATLPGYLDVAQFLKVDSKRGLFFFDNRFRSVPLTTSFIGVKKKNEADTMDMVCYEKVIGFIRDGHQAMVFVTSRNATATVAKRLIEIAQEKGTLHLFEPEKGIKINRTGYKNSDLGYLIPQGFGIHHAGMVRNDRLEVEQLFRKGEIKVIVCTTTLAWGVNLPAHAVIIRGTLHYDATKSSFVDMDMLDVQQIFGRAGRPQYDSSGYGIIITTMANMSKYMGLMLSQVPIESQFLNCIPDNLNAEIILGTNKKESFSLWMKLDEAAKILERSQMIRLDSNLGELRPTNFGRIASFYYISYQSMELFQEKFHRYISEADLLKLLSEASEFQQIQVRMDEIHELDRLREYNLYNIDLDFANVTSKVICLIQANISNAIIRVSSLASDCQYIMQTVVRLARALFEIAKDKNYALQVSRTLKLAQMMEQQMWDNDNPLWQFKELIPHLHTHRAMEIHNLSIEELKEMTERELENLFRAKHVAHRVRHYCNIFPMVDVDIVVRPITDGVIRVKLLITPTFKWDNQTHGTVQHYYAYVEDPSHDSIYHLESFVISKRLCQPGADPIELVFTVPLTKPLSLEYFVHIVNSQFLNSEQIKVINLDDLSLFTSVSIQTKILDLQPLAKKVLRNKAFEDLYPFTHFNTVQSQVFHSCYYTDTPILLGAPTGSGKTIVAELCMLRLFSLNPDQKVVYIAPMKALVRERLLDWQRKFSKINKRVIEVTGDITPRSEFIRTAHIIITTPEKWDAMSRNWTEKDFVKQVGLMIIDEIHLLGEDRGPVLEVIVSRMNCINHKKNTNVRIVGLSTAMANPGDLANWLNCDKRGLFNFNPSVRPVPLEIHIQGFDVKHYCPRMAAMNKSVYQAICQYAPDSSSLIFVSSRKQTRITGYEMMKFLMSENNPQKWMHCNPYELENVKAKLIDQDLAQLITFGIGMHHAGLTDSDRNLIEELYVAQKILVLVATATLAWGVNFPARLVVVKGTEYFDAATKRYVDMPITDVIQMAGRAGRPQFDDKGIACVMVQESKRNFYRKFLYEPFPVESNLLETLPDHVNAEIANGNIVSKSQLVEFIESTFFFRRLLANPNYYQLDANSDPLEFVSDLADSVTDTLQQHNCVARSETENIKNFYETTFLGMLGCQYYLSYKTVHFLSENMLPDNSIDDLLLLICQVEEYKLFPVRHNEDNINKDLARELDVRSNFPFDSPSLKVLLMIKCYLLDANLPNQEYVLDLKSVLDQIIRIIHAMMSLAAGRYWLDCTLKLVYVCQMLIQGYMISESNLIMLPYINRNNLKQIQNKLSKVLHSNDSDLSISTIRAYLYASKDGVSQVSNIFADILGNTASSEIIKTINDYPILTARTKVVNCHDNSSLEVTENHKNGFTEILGTEAGDHMFSIDIYREGSNQMNVHSKKFNKQKEEFWFLILALEGHLIFKKFSFNKKNKILELPINLRRGFYECTLYIMSDCYIGFDQSIKYSIKIK
ncbi:hypothetical protein GWI33_021579 [Rhynchophorus ferrugineus]|uniref:Activating signal cointegrator 1 complex subunit 3 n=1 Tax=Rhynchophorus ferrugineus TaxID=354439 RepID=A0A834IPH4_RHYFE|nr:hypothetical protein GWI33_021579 [Rhynchophorus ferrugineus]